MPRPFTLTLSTPCRQASDRGPGLSRAPVLTGWQEIAVPLGRGAGAPHTRSPGPHTRGTHRLHNSERGRGPSKVVFIYKTHRRGIMDGGLPFRPSWLLLPILVIVFACGKRRGQSPLHFAPSNIRRCAHPVGDPGGRQTLGSKALVSRLPLRGSPRKMWKPSWARCGRRRCPQESPLWLQVPRNSDGNPLLRRRIWSVRPPRAKWGS